MRRSWNKATEIARLARPAASGTRWSGMKAIAARIPTIAAMAARDPRLAN